MDSFTDLLVWQKGILLVKEIYRVTKLFPTDERFEMVRQLRKASTSILANIAEGCGRFTYPDKAAKYIIARGECTETKAFLLIASELCFVSIKEIAYGIELTDEIGRMISGLIASCKKSSLQTNN